MSATPFRDLPIRKRDVFGGDGTCDNEETVYCSHRKGSASVADCKVCPFAKSVEQNVVVCSRALSLSDAVTAEDHHVDITEAAARISLREIIGSHVTCVRADASVEQATALILERGLRCLPVVDSDDRLIGIVSKTDLVRDRADGSETLSGLRLEEGFHLEPVSRPISEIMTPCVRALPEDAPLAFAISLLAFESLHEVPVVDADGRVIGVATALDVLRWIAQRMGYVLASR